MAKLILPRMTEEAKQRFWSKVDVREFDECWLWSAGCFASGYGQFFASRNKLGKATLRAHRVSWSITHNKEIPEGKHVLHRCDVRHCVNPNHLFLGTDLDNMRDMSAKERTHNTKLTGDKIKEIRHMYATGNYTQRKLGKIFGVTCSRICDIVNHKTWRHVK